MKLRKMWLVGGVAIVLVVMVACGSPLTGAVDPTRVPAALPTAQVDQETKGPEMVAAPRAPSTPQAASKPTATPEASFLASLEEDCMAACHKEDVDITLGAMPIPASHQGRETCLKCHSEGNEKPLPATHLGRLDASCKVCHK